jgi:hypothetical protein
LDQLVQVLCMKTAVIALTAAGALVLPAGASAATRSFEGSIVSVNRAAKTFRISDAERGVKRIDVVASTSFHDLSGLSALHTGSANIEVIARRRAGRWVAVIVERSGGGGSHKGGGGSEDT